MRWRLAILLLLGGCRTTAAPPVRLPQPDVSAAAPRVLPLDARMTGSRAGADAGNSVVAASYTSADRSPREPIVGRGGQDERLSLDAAIELAIQQNPDLVALRRGEPVSMALLDVARTYPHNPQVTVEVLPITREPTGGPTPTPLTVAALQQTFEVAHQRRHRTRAGTADLEATRWNIVRSELLTVGQTERLFFTAVYQRERRQLAESTERLTSEQLGVLERSFDAGLTPPADVVLARIEAHAARQQAQRANAALLAALESLRIHLGVADAGSLQPVGSLTGWRWRPLREALREFPEDAPDAEESPGEVDRVSRSAVAQLVGERPDVNAARSDLQAAQARLDLARAMQRPNIAVGPFYEQTESGAQLFGLQVSRELAIVNTGAPLVRQRQAEVEQKCEIFRQAELKATLEIRSAAGRYERNRRVAESVRRDMDASAGQHEQRLKDLFEAGQTDLLHLYTARTQLLLLRTSLLDVLNDLALSAADLTAASGLPPSSLIDTGEN